MTDLLGEAERGERPAGRRVHRAVRHDTSTLESLLRRGRLVLLQGVVSTLADRLGAALLERAGEGADGEALRQAIEHIRVGAATDAAGRIEHRDRT